MLPTPPPPAAATVVGGTVVAMRCFCVFCVESELLTKAKVGVRRQRSVTVQQMKCGFGKAKTRCEEREVRSAVNCCVYVLCAQVTWTERRRGWWRTNEGLTETVSGEWCAKTKLRKTLVVVLAHGREVCHRHEFEVTRLVVHCNN